MPGRLVMMTGVSLTGLMELILEEVMTFMTRIMEVIGMELVDRSILLVLDLETLEVMEQKALVLVMEVMEQKVIVLVIKDMEQKVLVLAMEWKILVLGHLEVIV